MSLVRRVPELVLSALAFALVPAAPAAAALASFDGRVFRYRAQPGESTLIRGFLPYPYPHERSVVPVLLSLVTDYRVDVGFGCDVVLDGPTYSVVCPIGAVPLGELRYRFSLGATDDLVLGSQWFEGGVIYAGAGKDQSAMAIASSEVRAGTTSKGSGSTAVRAATTSRR